MAACFASLKTFLLNGDTADLRNSINIFRRFFIQTEKYSIFTTLYLASANYAYLTN